MPTFNQAIPVDLASDTVAADLRAQRFDSAGATTGTEILAASFQNLGNGKFVLVEDFTIAADDFQTVTIYVVGEAATPLAFSIVTPPVESGGGGLEGPSAVTLTFEDAAANPVASVDFTIVGQGSSRSDALGIATFGLPDGTYTVVARPANMVVFANTPLVVDGATSLTITGDTIATQPPALPNQTNATLVSVDGQGNIEADVEYTFKLLAGSGSAGQSPNELEFSATTDISGELTVTLIQGAQYAARRQDGRWIKFIAESSSVSQLPEILGRPQMG